MIPAVMPAAGVRSRARGISERARIRGAAGGPGYSEPCGGPLPRPSAPVYQSGARIVSARGGAAAADGEAPVMDAKSGRVENCSSVLMCAGRRKYGGGWV